MNFEFFDLYERSVQNPDAMLDFVQGVYVAKNRRKPTSLREDFCGTGLVACEWVKRAPRNLALGVDHSPEALEYARSRHLPTLTSAQQRRVDFACQDVRKPSRGRFDMIIALNHSYNAFTTRAELIAYLKNVRRSLRPGGLFTLDLFGGTRAQEERLRKFKHRGFEHQFECQAFNPVTNVGVFAIHFKQPGKKRLHNAFQYKWRLWSCVELREAMVEAGFKSTTAYFEGDGAKGEGDGKFTATEWEDNNAVWRAYIVASLES